MHIIYTTALITINETFFVQLISFLVFLYIMNRVMIRPLISTIAERKEYIANVNTEIGKAKSDLEQLDKALDLERTEALAEVNAAVHGLGEEADHQASGVMDASMRQISGLRRETEKKIDQQLKDARSRLAGEVDALTTLIMEKVLHRRLQS
jgi:F-type H+-transporting ATPase subunit b